MRATLTFGANAQRAFAFALFLLGLVATVYGWNYGLGRVNDIGPGAFPFGLGVALMALAGVAFFTVAPEALPARRSLRPMILVPAGIVAWALSVEAGGLLVANAALMTLMFFSEDGLKLRSAILVTLFLTLGGYLVLVLGFHLPFHIVGEWP